MILSYHDDFAEKARKCDIKLLNEVGSAHSFVEEFIHFSTGMKRGNETETAPYRQVLTVSHDLFAFYKDTG
jgi:hypothetical protein